MDEEERLLQEFGGMSYGHVNYAQLTQRLIAIRLEKLKKPHWSVVPLFWVSVIAAVAACIAAWPVISVFF